MRNLFPLLVILLPVFGSAQTLSPDQLRKIDSLNAIIDNSKSHDTALVQAYEQLGEVLLHSNADTLSYFSEKIISIVESSLSKNPSQQVINSLNKSLASAYNGIGYVHDKNGEVGMAIKYYTKSLSIFKEYGSKKQIAMCLNNLGYTYKKIGDIPMALEHYFKCLKIVEEIGDKQGMAVSMRNMGNVYDYQEDYLKALEYFQKSLKLEVAMNNKAGMANCILSIGTVYDNMGDLASAIEYYNKAKEASNEAGQRVALAASLHNLGFVYEKKKEYQKALEYFNSSLKMFKELNYKEGIAGSLNNMGRIYLTQDDLFQAQTNGEEALNISREVGYPDEIQESAILLSKIYQKQGKHKDALHMYQLHIRMRDSLNNEKTQKATAKQQAKYEYEKQKALDDAEYEKQLTLEQEAKEKQQIMTYATASGLGLVAIFLLFVFNRLKVTRRQKNIIEIQKKVVENQKEIVEERNKEITDSINYAKRLQEAILPPQRLVKEYLQQSFILYKPKDIVAGDFYWMETINDTVYFAAADCTGHGVPGAMVSVVCSNALSKALIEENITDVGKLLDRTRDLVVERFGRSEENIQDGMDISLCKLEVKNQKSKVKLEYAGANNPLWVIRKGATVVEETKADKQPIGKYDAEKPFTTHTIELKEGDTIYVFSDGYPDQFGGEKGKKYKTGAMKKFLLSIQDKDMATQRQSLNEEFESWKGELEQIDDVCVIGVRI